MNRAAIVGAGPSGFYAADALLKAGFAVDVFDALPTPYGLVRAGVAPDHPKIKSVIRVYAKTAAHESFRFFGGVSLGVDVSREDLLARYHAVIYAVGTATDNRLGIPGEDRPGSHAATEFVAWYNGHPHFADHMFDLNGGRAVVIGNGNVAIDVARMLVLDPTELRPTDTADHALEAFGMAGVTEVILLGRRGPAEAAFTNPELRELGELQRADVIVDPAQLEGVDEPQDGDATKRRNVEILRDYAQREPMGKSHRLELRFLRSPLEILGDGEDGPVTGVRVAINRLVPSRDGRVGAEPTGEEEDDRVRARAALDRLPGPAAGRGPVRRAPRADPQRRRHASCDDDGAVPRRVRGGLDQARAVRRDRHQQEGRRRHRGADPRGRRGRRARAGPTRRSSDADAIAAWLTERCPGHVTWEGWEAIDAHEASLGEPIGRPRVKLVRLAELLEASRGPS